jgi:hypothetical protein
LLKAAFPALRAEVSETIELLCRVFGDLILKFAHATHLSSLLAISFPKDGIPSRARRRSIALVLRLIPFLGV